MVVKEEVVVPSNDVEVCKVESAIETVDKEGDSVESDS